LPQDSKEAAESVGEKTVPHACMALNSGIVGWIQKRTCKSCVQFSIYQQLLKVALFFYIKFRLSANFVISFVLIPNVLRKWWGGQLLCSFLWYDTGEPATYYQMLYYGYMVVRCAML
jgi:hypothetical protein